MALATGHPNAIGAMAAPARVGGSPSTLCTQSGTNVTVAIIAAPMSAPAAEATTITRCEKRSSGRSGSRARRSTAMNAAVASAATGMPTSAARGERAASSAAITAIARSAAPATSSRCS